MTIEIILHGVKMTVTKDQLFELAANGGITKDTPVNVSGKMVAAKQIKGLVFGTEESPKNPTPSVAVPHAVSAPPVTNVVPYLERDSHLNLATPAERLVASFFEAFWGLVLSYPCLLYICACPVFIAVMVGTLGPLRDPSLGIVAPLLGAGVTWVWLVLTNWVKIHWTSCYAQGTTMGKIGRGLYVVDAITGEAPSISAFLVRETVGKWFISPIFFSLGYIWILVDQNNQGWHDKFVNTIVIKKEPGSIPPLGFTPIFGYRTAAIITAVCGFVYFVVFGISFLVSGGGSY